MRHLFFVSMVTLLSIGCQPQGEPEREPDVWVDDDTDPDTDPGPRDTTPPVLEAHRPADGARDVALDTVIRLEFSEFLTEDSTATIALLGPNGPVDIVRDWDGAANLSLEPQSDLIGETTYSVLVSADVRDLSDNAMGSEVRFSFTTADATAPELITTSPVDGADEVDIDARIRLVFSEPVDPSSVRSDTVVVHPTELVDGVFYDDGEGLAVDIVVNGTEVLLTPKRGSLQEYETGYEVTIDGVTDAAGNRVARRTFGFETVVLDGDYSYRVRRAVSSLPALSIIPRDSRPTLVDASSGEASSYWYVAGPNGDLVFFNKGWGDAFSLGERLDRSLHMERARVNDGHWWTAARAAPRGARAGESPYMYYLHTRRSGPAYSPGVVGRDGSGRDIVGMQRAVAFDDQTWVLQNVGRR